LSVIIADIWQWTPFIFILALAALQSLPRRRLRRRGSMAPPAGSRSLHQAAADDAGADRHLPACADRRLQGSRSDPGDDRWRPRTIDRNPALRISRTATEFAKLGEAAAMSNYLLILLMLITAVMFVYTRLNDARLARIRAAGAKAAQAEEEAV
jgi:multiple sugar transport system permease protein